MIKVLYLCDPEKNKKCSKTWCKYNLNNTGIDKDLLCMSTSKVEYAKTINDGAPVISCMWEDDTDGRRE